MDAKVKPTWTYSRRLQKLITGLRYGNCNKKCKENLLNLICTLNFILFKSIILNYKLYSHSMHCSMINSMNNQKV